jgi:3-hydroxyisobutyrate dehydrogenase/2-hydroxy-3-oxopropionate reductase
MSRVAVLGLGAMGSRMARRLLDAGHSVVVWNRDVTKAAPLAAAGAVAAPSPSAAASGSEAVITMLTDGDALREVVDGPSGVFAGATTPTTLIQMSTVGLEATRRLAAGLPETVELLDAPVLGSLAEVEAGSLQIFAGAPDALVEQWAPLLGALGRVRHIGPVGAGSAAKLVANASLVGVVALLGEVLALAQSVGLERDAAFDVLAATPLAAQAERRRAAIDDGDYPRRFALSLARKDADLVVEAGAGADLRLLPAARSWYADAEADGAGELDYTAVLSRILRG